MQTNTVSPVTTTTTNTIAVREALKFYNASTGSCTLQLPSPRRRRRFDPLR